MQAVILCAGLGARLQPHTNTTPKTLLLVQDKTLLEHVLNSLPEEITEIILVIHHLGEQIKEKIGSTYRSVPVRYVLQKELNGTGGAMMCLSDILHDRFLVLNGDDLYHASDLKKMLQYPQAILLSKTTIHLQFGAILDRQGFFIGLDETNMQINNRICGAYLLTTDYFTLPPVEIDGTNHKELGLPQTLAQCADKNPIPVVFTDHWHPVGTPEELEVAQHIRLKK